MNTIRIRLVSLARPTLVPLAAVALAAGLLAAPGCTNLARGDSVAAYEKGGQPVVSNVGPGTYALYEGNFATAPKATFTLSGENNPLGFRPGDTGQVIAVAGDETITLPSADYRWKKVGE